MCLFVRCGIAIELVSNYTRIQNLDGSTGEYAEEEGCYQEEEEEQFENYQGKLNYYASFNSCKVQSPFGQGTMFLPFLM